MNARKPRHDAPEQPGDEEIQLAGAGFLKIGSGGKVDAEAIRQAVEAAGPEDDDAELRRVTFRIRRDLDSRLDRYLTNRISFMSRTQLQRVIREGGVLVNSKLPKVSTLLHAGDIVEVVVPEQASKTIVPEEMPLTVLYEDEYLIVLNKQPGVIVHPARSHLKGTMISGLAYYFQKKSALGGTLSAVGTDFARPGVVHRLDRHTSGCIVFAKQDEAHWKLGHQFEHRTVDKRYLAVVRGRMEPDGDVIDLPIGGHPSKEKGYRKKYLIRHDNEGKRAITIYRVRERYKWHTKTGTSAKVGEPANADSDHFTLVELELKTGRTHQIRVHLSHLGYPIVGDDMYGGRPFTDLAGNAIIERQALHACLLAFDHPITGQRMTFTAPVRGDIGTLINTLRTTRTDRLDPAGAWVKLEEAVAE